MKTNCDENQPKPKFELDEETMHDTLDNAVGGYHRSTEMMKRVCIVALKELVRQMNERGE